MTERLERLGYYYGETYIDDPNRATTRWLRSDGAGSSVPVTPEEQSLINLVLATAQVEEALEDAVASKDGSCGVCGARPFHDAGGFVHRCMHLDALSPVQR